MTREPAPAETTATSRPIPGPVRLAALIAVTEGALGLAFAAYLVVHEAMGHHEDTVVISGYGTAVWFVIVAGGVLAAGVGLLRGRRWGRGLVVFAELLLLPVAWYLATGSERPVAGVVVAAVAIVALVALFRRESVDWWADR